MLCRSLVLTSSVLLLNASHEPLAVVPSRRAIVLVLAGKAVSLEDRESVLHAAGFMMNAPAVIRLTRYVRIPYRPPATVSRAGVLRRDGRRCAYCAARGETIDHVLPRSRGGSHSWENCVACCGRCNTRKADRTLDEIGWSLDFTPGPPLRRGAEEFSVAGDPDWRHWLTFDAA